MGVSENNGTPKSSILIGFSIINHPFWGTSIFGNTHIVMYDNNTYLPALHLYPSPAMWPTSADHQRWEAPQGGRPKSPTESPQPTKWMSN